MKLSNRKVLLIIVLISISLSGLILLQTQLLKTAIKSEEEAFHNNINVVLNNVVKEISNQEAAHAVLKFKVNDTTLSNGKRIIRKETITSGNHNIFNKKTIIADTLKYDKNIKKADSNKKTIQYEVMATTGVNHILVFDTSGSHLQNQHPNPLGSIWEENQYGYKYSFDEDSISISGNFSFTDSSRTMLIETILEELNQQEFIPIQKRIDSTELKNIIANALNEAGIKMEYEYAIINTEKDSILLSNSLQYDSQLKNSVYQARLFPLDLFALPNYISFYFPDKQFYIYSKLGKIILPTIVFLLILISCFIYSVRTIIKQQVLSVRLRDFINNMTHEFKTPISTVQLAVEAIAKDNVLNDKEKILQLNSMIKSENSRMKNQVDKILQIATLEDRDFELNRERLDLHVIINETVELLKIHVLSNQGEIVSNLEAVHSTISADRVHITNIVHNLLENAVKYSPVAPEIKISTTNIDNRINLTIHDNGIGIHPDDLPLVFDKYYRVTKGDIHDVKGFGLGLSYVKMMTEAHMGTVSIVSALEKGTEVSITLPLEEVI